VAKNNTIFRLKDVKELVYAALGKITKDAWTKAEEHVVKIEKEYYNENCIDRSVIEPIIFDFCDDDSDDDTC
jgi:predicted nucleotidyltransferase